MKKNDILFEQARYAVIEAGNASASYLQRKLGIGYEKAISFMDRLEKEEIVGKARGAKPRKVLIKPIDGTKDIYLEKGSIEDEKLYEESKKIIQEAGRASSSLLMRKLGIGYARSAMLMDMLKARGQVNNTKKLVTLISTEGKSKSEIKKEVIEQLKEKGLFNKK